MVPSELPPEFVPECMSCATPLHSYARGGVPQGIDCCLTCWRKVSVADRLRFSIAIRDRQLGGALYELAELLRQSIEQHTDGTS